MTHRLDLETDPATGFPARAVLDGGDVSSQVPVMNTLAGDGVWLDGEALFDIEVSVDGDLRFAVGAESPVTRSVYDTLTALDAEAPPLPTAGEFEHAASALDALNRLQAMPGCRAIGRIRSLTRTYGILQGNLRQLRDHLDRMDDPVQRMALWDVGNRAGLDAYVEETERVPLNNSDAGTSCWPSGRARVFVNESTEHLLSFDLVGRPMAIDQAPFGAAQAHALGRVGPLPPYELAVPAQEGLGRDRERCPTFPRKRPGRNGEQGPIHRTKLRTAHLSAKHLQLVTKHKDLDVLGAFASRSCERGGRASARAIRERMNSIRACHGSASWKARRSFRPLQASRNAGKHIDSSSTPRIRMHVRT